MKVDRKLLNGNHSHYCFKHGNNGPCFKQEVNKGEAKCGCNHKTEPITRTWKIFFKKNEKENCVPENDNSDCSRQEYSNLFTPSSALQYTCMLYSPCLLLTSNYRCQQILQNKSTMYTQVNQCWLWDGEVEKRTYRCCQNMKWNWK